MELERFELREQQVKLLRKANVGWDECEFGAPAIDCKRPFGNGDVYEDMADILGLGPEWREDEDGNIPPERLRRLDRLYRSLKTALQVVLAAGTFEPGLYVSPQHMDEWRPATPEEVAAWKKETALKAVAGKGVTTADALPPKATTKTG